MEFFSPSFCFFFHSIEFNQTDVRRETYGGVLIITPLRSSSSSSLHPLNKLRHSLDGVDGDDND